MDRLTEEEAKRLGTTWDSIPPQERIETLEKASREDKVMLSKWNLVYYLNERKELTEYLIRTTSDLEILQEAFIEYINQQNA